MMNEQSAQRALPLLTLIGHPNLTIGRGEHIRTVWRAFRAAGVRASIYNLLGLPAPPEPAFQELVPHTVTKIPGGIRIFHLNGDEIAHWLPEIDRRQSGFFCAGYNIVYPAWELPRYPEEWARQLDRFDEVWAPTPFVEDCLRAALWTPVLYQPDACEPHLAAPLPRSHFGLKDTSFLLLCFFDVNSYVTRKNPYAVVETFRRAVTARPNADLRLVLKVNNAERHPNLLPALHSALADLRDRVTLFPATMTDIEIKSLVRCCDCFISLHRSEGFGRGPAEAMFFGKPVIATGWSGNMDYMNHEVSFPVAFDLIAVKEGEYPAWQNQRWADPRITDATQALLRLIDDPALAREVGERARVHMHKNYSDQVVGLRYRARLCEIAGRLGNNKKSK